MYQQTTATHKLQALQKRIRGVSGGTSASKTISILLILINAAQTYENLVIDVVSETFPHLKRGAVRDFLDILKEHQYYQPKRWNKTDSIYTFETGSIIEFFSLFDQPQRARGPRRDILFINEANNISFETYTQLEIRTNLHVWLDWNPVNEFWFYTELLGKPFVDFISLTYKDNEALSPAIVESIEAKRDNKNWWKVYGEGQLGEVELRIYTGWQIIKTIPKEARFECGWLDYGYSNDPTAAGGIYYINGWYLLDEWIYQTGLLNPDIVKLLKPNLPKDGFVVADSAEPKSNAELTLAGITVIPATKGKDSVINGIQVVQTQKIAVTERSVNLLKEYRNYLWQTDRDGKIVNVPSGIFNHHMDGIRYAFTQIEPLVANRSLGAGEAPSSKPKSPVYADDLIDLSEFEDAVESSIPTQPRSYR